MSKEQDDRFNERNDAASEGADLTAAAAALEASESEIGKLRADLEDATDRVLRAQAELENYRKRARRELEDERRYAIVPLLHDLLPVIDNVFRAIAAAERQPGSDGLLEGVKMISQSLLGVLARHQCTPIEALHQPFDPAYHQAISQQVSAEYPPNTVILVAQEGYILGERVIRPAQVIVSKAPE